LVKGAPEMSVAPPTGQDRIMIYGPKSDGTYIIDLGYTTERILKFSAHLGADPA